MAGSDELFDEGEDGIALRVHVQPGAGETKAMGRHGNALKIRVAAPPEKGRANEATVEYLADVLGLKKSEVEIVSGQTARQKKVSLKGIEAPALVKRLDVLLATKKRRP